MIDINALRDDLITRIVDHYNGDRSVALPVAQQEIDLLMPIIEKAIIEATRAPRKAVMILQEPKAMEELRAKIQEKD